MSMNIYDVLGVPASPWQAADPASAGGPNQNYVAPAFANSQIAMGGTAPAFSLVGLVLLLVAWRLAIELGAE